MAIRDSSSGLSEWAQLYLQRNVPSQPTAGGSHGGGTSGGVVFGRDSPMTESTVVTTTTVVPASSPPAGNGGDRVQAVSVGRVGKAARRRARASRKAPTTVLNTDTANFRAMVQQFTGVPTVPFQGGYPHVAEGGAATLSFGLAGGAAQLYQRPPGFPFGVQQQQQQQAQQQQHLHYFQQHHERPLFTLGGAGSSDVYLRGFGGNPERGVMDASEGLLPAEGIPPSQLMPRPSASADRATTNRFLL